MRPWKSALGATDFLPRRERCLAESVEKTVSPPIDIRGDLEQHRSYLMKVARLQLRDVDLAQDAVQETMLAALKSGTFTGASSLRTWLTSILRHKIVDAIRKRQRLAEVSESSRDSPTGDGAESSESSFDDEGEWRTKPADWGDPEQALNQRQFLDIVSRCMEHLPPRQARVFLMREYMDFDVAEISRELKITAGNVHVTLHRARIGLRQCVERNWLGEQPWT